MVPVGYRELGSFLKGGYFVGFKIRVTNGLLGSGS